MLKIAISNKETEIVSSALISILFMTIKGFGVAKNWINELSEKLYSSLTEENLHTYHCLLLMKQIKSNDRLFLVKTYSKMTENSTIKSKFSICQLLRYISELIDRSDLDKESFETFHNFLERSIYNIEESIRI